MRLGITARWALVLGCMTLAPVYGQSTTTSGTTSTTSTTTTTTSTKTTHAMHHRRASGMGSTSKSRVWMDSTRLGALLLDAQSNANISSDAWKVSANEANALANRIYSGASGNKTARDAAKNLRMHVQEMRKAALAGDAAGAKSHAGLALPFADTITDWSMPASMGAGK